MTAVIRYTWIFVCAILAIVLVLGADAVLFSVPGLLMQVVGG